MHACMDVCMYVWGYVCMYVCSCMCVTKLRVKDAACERWCVCATVQTIFFASAAMSAAVHAAALRTWNGLNEVFHDLLCSMRCNEMCYVTAAPVLQPRIRRWWHRGKVPGRRSYSKVPRHHGCAIVPRLPREIKVDVTKCHACHAEVPRRHGRHARLNRAQGRHPVPWVRRLPRKTTVDVRLCHTCHVKSRWMSPSATPATQKWRGATGITRD